MRDDVVVLRLHDQHIAPEGGARSERPVLVRADGEPPVSRQLVLLQLLLGATSPRPGRAPARVARANAPGAVRSGSRRDTRRSGCPPRQLMTCRPGSAMSAGRTPRGGLVGCPRA